MEKYVLEDEKPEIWITFKFNRETEGLLPTMFNTYLNFSLFREEDFIHLIQSKKSNQSNIKLSKYYSINSYYSDLELSNQILLSNFSFFIFIGSEFYYRDVGIGLSYKFENQRLSFVHCLFNEGFIDKKIFSFQQYTIGFGKIYFGTLADDTYSELKYKGFCSVNRNHKEWGCNLKQIKYGNETIELKQFSFFHTSFSFMFCSNEIFDKIINLFKHEISTQGCSIIKTSQKAKGLSCTEDIVKGMENKHFQFFFDDMIINISANYLFLNDKNYTKRFAFYSNPYEIYNETTIIGFPFLNLFSLASFNYDEGKIYFFSDIHQIISPKLFEVIKMLFTIITITLLTMTLFLLLNSCIYHIQKNEI